MPVAEARVSVAVSTAVFGVRPDPHGVPRLCVALVPRMREPFLDRWALPGAWLGADEELADVAARVAAECVPGPVRRLEQLAAFGARPWQAELVTGALVGAILGADVEPEDEASGTSAD